MVYLNDHVDELDVESALAQVSPQRREQALRFRHVAGQRLCLAAYLLLKRGLLEEYGIPENPILSYNPDGKPSLVGHPNIHFNFSHSGNVALCVLSNQPVGADVETRRRVTPELISYTMNDAEQAHIQTAPEPTIEFLHYWTQKEAVLKLSGEGIRNNMKEVLAEANNIALETILTERYIYSIAQYKNQTDVALTRTKFCMYENHSK